MFLLTESLSTHRVDQLHVRKYTRAVVITQMCTGMNYSAPCTYTKYSIYMNVCVCVCVCMCVYVCVCVCECVCV